MGAESRVGAADGGGDALRSRVPWLLRYGCFRGLVGSKVLDAEAFVRTATSGSKGGQADDSHGFYRGGRGITPREDCGWPP
jgi:hypothetical protein